MEVLCRTNIWTVVNMFFCHACAWIAKQKNRQLYLKELSPLSLLRNTTYTLIFLAQREYLYLFSTYIDMYIISITKHHILSFFSFLFWQTLWILQCYIWHANCLAHNTCLLHFDGAMKKRKKYHSGFGIHGSSFGSYFCQP